MLSEKRAILALEAHVSPSHFGLQFPLCGLRDLCAMLSEKRAILALEALVSPSHFRLQSPLASVTSVRCSLRNA
jgi:hypothetical protein